MSAPDLAPLRTVLDRTADAGRTIPFWWRDDDAVAHTPALDRLLSLGRSLGCPIAVAVIPARLEASLPDRMMRQPETRILVHGFAHTNHAPPPEKKAEFGTHRPDEQMAREAEAGWSAISRAFGAAALPVFVPPWNRIASPLVERLPELGLCGLSTFGPRPLRPTPGLTIANTHLDPVDWRGSGGAVSPQCLADALAEASSAARPDDPEPIGFLTHHLRFDEELWSLSERLLTLIVGHPAIRLAELDILWRPKLSLNCTAFDDLTSHTKQASGDRG